MICSLPKFAMSSVVVFVAFVSGVQAQTADVIYFGGPIVTVNDKQPSAEAVAIKNGKIIAVGAKNSLMKYKGASTKSVDLAGRTMIPGFIDAHGHLANVGIQAVAANLLAPPDGDVNSISALQQVMRKWIASSTVSKNYGIILGFGYDDAQLKEQRHPVKEELDAISKDLPVLLVHQSGHLCAMNSKALAIAGITSATKDPAGGRIRRKPGSQEPDGVMEETAFFGAMVKVLPPVGAKEMRALLQAGQDLYARFGHTTAQEGRAPVGIVQAEAAAAADGLLKLDIVAYPDIDMIGNSAIMKSKFYSRTNYVQGFRIGGVKINFDGSPQGKTAWLTKPYYKVPEGLKPDYHGYPTYTDAQAIERVKRAFANNWQVLVHVNGDAAIDQYIKAVAAARVAYPNRSVRPVAIHSQTIRKDQVAKFQELGIFPSLFPMHTFYWGDWHRDSVLGPERAANISPTAWVLSRGMLFSSHHDAPVGFPDTLRVLSATVTRKTRSGQILGPEHCVEPIIGLKAMTLWAAYQHFEEKTKGSIEVGKLADFAILSDNPLTIDKDKIADIKVVETIKRGKSIYKRTAKAAQTGLSVAENPIASARMTAVLSDNPAFGAFASHRH